MIFLRSDSRFAPSQWETSLQSSTVSHWLGANLKSALFLFSTRWPSWRRTWPWFGFCLNTRLITLSQTFLVLIHYNWPAVKASVTSLTFCWKPALTPTCSVVTRTRRRRCWSRPAVVRMTVWRFYVKEELTWILKTCGASPHSPRPPSTSTMVWWRSCWSMERMLMWPTAPGPHPCSMPLYGTTVLSCVSSSHMVPAWTSSAEISLRCPRLF